VPHLVRYPPYAPRAGAFPRRSVDLTAIHRRLIPIAGTQFTKTSEIETPSLRFPLQAGGTEPTRPTRFPSRSGGNLQEGGNCKLCPCDWYNFISVLNANLATFGLVAADLTPLTNARNDFQTKLGNFQTAETAFRAASEAKKTSRNTAEPLFRQMAQRINRHPAMTNALRAQLRLTVPKPRQRRGVGPEIPGVRLEVDAGRVVIHFGTNPDDETRNGKPAWAIGANIYIKAEDEADYRLLAFDTASPYVWEYRGAPKRFSFRVAYRGTRERDEGTLSPEETVSVGG
jgi:hypothetical protein